MVYRNRVHVVQCTSKVREKEDWQLVNIEVNHGRFKVFFNGFFKYFMRKETDFTLFTGPQRYSLGE